MRLGSGAALLKVCGSTVVMAELRHGAIGLISVVWKADVLNPRVDAVFPVAVVVDFFNPNLKLL